MVAWGGVFVIEMVLDKVINAHTWLLRQCCKCPSSPPYQLLILISVHPWYPVDPEVTMHMRSNTMRRKYLKCPLPGRCHLGSDRHRRSSRNRGFEKATRTQAAPAITTTSYLLASQILDVLGVCSRHRAWQRHRCKAPHHDHAAASKHISRAEACKSKGGRTCSAHEILFR